MRDDSTAGPTDWDPLHEADEFEPIFYGPDLYELRRKKRRIPRINLILFIITLFTTLLTGAYWAGANPLDSWTNIFKGIPFSFSLILILLSHELGHYVVSRYHNMDVSLPYFLPAPPFFSPIGTFGAFIKIKSPIRDKRSLLDVGAAGPLVGLIVTVPILVAGLKMSRIIQPAEMAEGKAVSIQLGSSLLFELISRITLGIVPHDYHIILHPVAFAGWIGILVTSMNLMPVGQLDGGHIIYAILGERARALSSIVIVALLFLGFKFWNGWLIWAILLLVLGRRHPPPMDSWTPLDRKRKIIGVISIAAFIITFIPVPFKVG